MDTLIVAVALGFVLGMRHAADPDHVAAVSAILARTRRRGASWWVGACWGLGHSLTIFAVGAPLVLFKLAVPPRLEVGLELLVGVMLILLGALTLRGRGRALLALGGAVHLHEHEHDPGHGHHLPGVEPGRHEHPHPHEARLGRFEAAFSAVGLPQSLRTFAVGVVHGLAGSAAAAFLVLAAIPSPWGGVLFLALFGLGTVAGMMVLSAAIEASVALASRRFPLERWVAPAAGLLSLLVGLSLVIQTGLGARPGIRFHGEISDFAPRQGATKEHNGSNYVTEERRSRRPKAEIAAEMEYSDTLLIGR